MKKFLKGTKFKVFVAVCAALLLGILVAAVSTGRSSPLTDAVSFVVSPLQKAASAVADDLRRFRLGFTSSAKYKEEIYSLEEEIETYRSMLVDYEKDKKKLEAYEEFLELKEQHPDYKFTDAGIISRSVDDIYGTFTVDKGGADGVKVNDPVIFGDALVGIVSSVTETTAEVYTLFNPNVNVSVYEIRTRLDCIIESDNLVAMNGMFRLTGLSGSTPIVPGGIIATSGVGGKYPADLLVGTVAEIIDDDTTVSAYGLVTPELDLTELRDVFILTDFN